MSKDFTVDDTLFRAKAKQLVKKLKIDEHEFVKDQSAQLARTICKATPPFKGGVFPRLTKPGYQEGSVKDAVAAGERAIKHDLGVIFRQRSEGYLKHVHDVTGKKRNIRQVLRNKAGKTYLIDVDIINYNSFTDAIKWHWQKRLSNGRVKNYRKGNKDSQIGRWQSRDVMWITPEIWQKVFKQLSANVGLSKAAFGKAAMKLGIKQKPPKYIKRHFSKVDTSVIIQRNPSVVTIHGSAPGLEIAERKLNKIKEIRSKAMVKRLEYLLRANAKKAGFKTK